MGLYGSGLGILFLIHRSMLQVVDHRASECDWPNETEDQVCENQFLLEKKQRIWVSEFASAAIVDGRKMEKLRKHRVHNIGRGRRCWERRRLNPYTDRDAFISFKLCRRAKIKTL